MAPRGPRSSRVNPFIAVDDEGRITTPLPCHVCSYLLVGQLPSAACPECGEPITRSMRHGLPRFAPSYHLETLSRASLIALIGWLMMIGLGVGTALVLPGSVAFVLRLRKMQVVAWRFDVAVIGLLSIGLAAGAYAGLLYLEWLDSYSFWSGYAAMDDGYYLALALLALSATLLPAVANLAAIRLARVCRWPHVARTLWAAFGLTLLLGMVPILSQIYEVTGRMGVLELWWEAWNDTLGSPFWWAVGAGAVAQGVAWFRVRRALQRLLAERHAQA